MGSISNAYVQTWMHRHTHTMHRHTHTLAQSCWHLPVISSPQTWLSIVLHGRATNWDLKHEERANDCRTEKSNPLMCYTWKSTGLVLQINVPVFLSKIINIQKIVIMEQQMKLSQELTLNTINRKYCMLIITLELCRWKKLD